MTDLVDVDFNPRKKIKAFEQISYVQTPFKFFDCLVQLTA